jgi:hypothetical protein
VTVPLIGDRAAAFAPIHHRPTLGDARRSDRVMLSLRNLPSRRCDDPKDRINRVFRYVFWLCLRAAASCGCSRTRPLPGFASSRLATTSGHGFLANPFEVYNHRHCEKGDRDDARPKWYPPAPAACTTEDEAEDDGGVHQQSRNECQRRERRNCGNAGEPAVPLGFGASRLAAVVVECWA